MDLRLHSVAVLDRLEVGCHRISDPSSDWSHDPFDGVLFPSTSGVSRLGLSVDGTR